MHKELKKIVMIDDDEDDRDIFTMTINSINPQIDVLSLFDGVCLTEYMQKNTNETPDILFLDINMPRKNGFECLEEIRSKYSQEDLPIVMYSTSESEADINYSKELGANLYVKKPTDFSSLKKILSSVLDIDWSNTDIPNKNFLFKC